jgi:hypothetical protein
MPSSNQYYTLIGSLPALPTHFADVERVPISSLRLDERLKMLRPEDTQTIENLTDFLAWDRQPLEKSDEAVCRHYEAFMAHEKNPMARNVIEQAMTIRTIVAALRRRQRGLEPSSSNGPWMEHIRRNWKHADFRLGQRFPWIREAEARLGEQPPSQADRALLEIVWKIAKRLSDEYQFTFEAVILYLVRWELVNRWTSRDAAKGREQFETLVRDAMAQYADMFAAEDAAQENA